VFWRNDGTGANVIWKSGIASTPQAVTGVTTQSWKVVGVGDFDGDGKADVFWRNTSNGATTIWKAGNSTTLQATTAVTDQNWRVQQIGDFNGDGKSDVLWRNIATGADVIWRSGNSATTQPVTTVGGQAWIIVPYENQALGTVNNGPVLSIADVSAPESNTGTHLMTFTVQLSKAATTPVTYNIATSNGSAMSGSDYVARSLAGETIASGQSSRAFAVTVTGDTAVEGN
jgi:hypothetical protein